jgi:GT2 family glycosyltransferase
MEEYELCYRTIDSNMSVLFTREIEILHKVNKAGRETNSIKYGRQLQNKTLLAYIYLPSVYFYAHFVMWSLFFLLKSRLNLSLYAENVKSLYKRIQKATKRPISKSGLQYLGKVKARLWY